MSDPRLIADRDRPGAWFVRVGGADQSYIVPDDPTWLEFDYVQRIAAVIDQIAPAGQRLRVVHVGGGGLTLPRYVAVTRPTSAQVVLEPDASLTAAVRAVAPLPPRSGIKVRPLDGRTGVAALPTAYCDLMIVDAFQDAGVPADLATREWFAEVSRVLVADGTLVVNLTDHSPFAWSRRTIAGLLEAQPDRALTTTLAAEPATLKGRRFGNLVVAAGPRLDPAQLARQAARAAFPYRLLTGQELTSWVGGAEPWTDATAEPSPPPPGGPTTFR
ncbi:MAG: fused MFS/spermidine synthase [Propionibacteriaceae bacterium]|jgi:spermidine synthase|nr:fused MFS/spermidine synthase [Propionibacteriaceae bacterium]